MTKVITLESKVEQIIDVFDYGWDLGNLSSGIPDFKVREFLGFTSQRWSRYRPLLIQYYQNNDLIKEERDRIRIQTITRKWNKSSEKEILNSFCFPKTKGHEYCLQM